MPTWKHGICLLTALALLGLEQPARAGAFVIVVNKANSLSSISSGDLKKAFTGGTKQWASGAVVQVGLIPSDAPETAYLSSLMSMTPRELIARIQEQVFKGEMRRPVVLKSSQDCVAFARANPGGVCVATAGQAIPPEANVIALQ